MPPGPELIPVYYTVNFAKGTMMLYLLALMVYFDNFSVGAWIYLGLHGSYGVLWVARDLAFPDSATQKRQTFLSWLVLLVPVLGPYQLIGYWMMSGGDLQRNPSGERIFVAL